MPARSESDSPLTRPSPVHRASDPGEASGGTTRRAPGSASLRGSATSPAFGMGRHRRRFERHGIYATQHGRDQLAKTGPSCTRRCRARIFRRKSWFDWNEAPTLWLPECYFDPAQERLVLAPEYGGTAEKPWDPARQSRDQPRPSAHWAPNDLLFYTGDGFLRYRGGVFILFHARGTGRRAPRMGTRSSSFLANGKPTGKYEVFADDSPVRTRSGQAAHRPSGLALGPDGALYSRRCPWPDLAVAYTGASPVARGPSASGQRTPAPGGGATAPPSPRNPSGPPKALILMRELNLAAPPRLHGGGNVGRDDPRRHTRPWLRWDNINQVAGATCAGVTAQCQRHPARPDLTDSQWIWGDGSLAASPRPSAKVCRPEASTRESCPHGRRSAHPSATGRVGAYVYSLGHSAGRPEAQRGELWRNLGEERHIMKRFENRTVIITGVPVE